MDSFVRVGSFLLHAKFSIRALLLFTTIVACFFAFNRFAWPQYSLVHYVGPLPDRCLKQPHVVRYGWPAISRTDQLADHPRHETGDCKFDPTYRLIGLAINAFFACLAATALTSMLVYLPPFIAWQSFLREERRMIDRITARE